MTDFNDPLETDPYPNEPFVVPEVDRARAQVRQARQRARTAIDVDNPSAQAIDRWSMMALQDPKQPQGETEWADTPKSFVSGAGGLAASAAGAGEYLANYFAGGRQTPSQQGAGGVADWFTGARHSAEAFSQDWFKSMTPEAQARSQRDILSLDPDKTIWQGGVREVLSSMALKMSQSAPSALVTLLPGAILMRVGLAGGVTYLGASEGALSMGSIAANIANEVEQAPEAQLMQAPRYAQLRRSMNESQARQQLIAEAQGYAPVIGGLTVGAISALAGRYFEPIITDGASGMAGRFARGYVNEGLAQEAPQSAAEQIAQNWAAQTFDSNRPLLQGAGEAAAQGTVAGGPMGGLTAAALGRGPAPQQAEPPPTIPGETAPQGPPSFEQVFGGMTEPPPPGGSGWLGGDVEFGDYDQTPSARLERGVKGKMKGKVIPSDQPELREQQYDATGQKMMDLGPVDRDVQAALNIRRDRKMDDLFSPPSPQGPIQQGLQKAGQQYQQGDPFLGGQRAQGPLQPSQQIDAFQMPMGAPTTTMTEQQPLGITDERGTVIEPTPGQPLVTDMGVPDQAAGIPEQQRRAQLEARARAGLGPQELPSDAAARTRRNVKLGLENVPRRPPSGVAPTDLREGQLPNLGQQDFFPPDEPPPPPGGQGPRSQLEGFTVTARDESGAVLSEQTVLGPDEANDLADAWHKGMPHALINVRRTYHPRGGRGAAAAAAAVAPALEDDTAGAEPMSDIRAQLEDLADPEHPRLGVYLSAANLAILDEKTKAGLLDVGVPLVNFDGKGGLVLAKNRKVAEEILRFRDSGAADMQEILGFITGAGQGKPRGANIVVQQRDEEGNVVRESGVASPEEADQLAEQFDEPNVGRQGVVISVEMALKRRAAKMAAEQARAKTQAAAREQRGRVAGAVPGASIAAVAQTDAAKAATEVAELRAQIAEAQQTQNDAPTRAGKLKARETEKRLNTKLLRLLSRVSSTVQAHPVKPVVENPRHVLEELAQDTPLDVKQQEAELQARVDKVVQEIETLRKQVTEAASAQRDAPTRAARSEAQVTEQRLRREITELEREIAPAPDATALIKQLEKEDLNKLSDAQINALFEEAIHIQGGATMTRTATETEPGHGDEEGGSEFDDKTTYMPTGRRGKRTFKDAGQQALYDELLAKYNKNPSDKLRTRLDWLLANSDVAIEPYQQDIIEALREEHPERSHKVKYIRRLRRTLHRRAYGSGVRTSEITAKGGTVTEPSKRDAMEAELKAQQKILDDLIAANRKKKTEASRLAVKHQKKVVARYERWVQRASKKRRATPVRKSELHPTNLFDLDAPREMGPEEKAKHASRERAAYSALTSNVAGLNAKMEKLNARLQKLGSERETGGNPPHNARTAIYGRYYLHNLIRYAELYQQMHPRSRSALNEIERINKLFESLRETDTDKFLTALADAMAAELEHQARVAMKIDPEQFKNLSTAAKRFAQLKKYNEELVASAVEAKRITDVWHKNAKFNTVVQPLMEKLMGWYTMSRSLGSTKTDFERRGLGYTPTFSELRALRYALREFKETDRILSQVPVKNFETVSMYQPLKEWFMRFGYKFDKAGDLKLAKSASQYEHVVPGIVLQESAEDRQFVPKLDVTGLTKAQADRAAEIIKQQIQDATDRAKMPDPTRRLGAPLTATQRKLKVIAEQKAAAQAVVDRAARLEDQRRALIKRGEEAAVERMKKAEEERRALLTPAEREAEDRALEKRLTKHLEANRSRLRPAEIRALDRDPNREPDYSGYAPPTGMKNFTVYSKRQRNLHHAGTQAAAEAVAAHIEEYERVDANDLLYALAAKLPSKHPYRVLVRRLLDLGMADIVVHYKDMINPEHMGDYTQYTDSKGRYGVIGMNRDEFERMRASGQDPSGEFVHTLLHEMVHAATMGALYNNAALRNTFETLLRDTRAAAKEQGIDLRNREGDEHYGVRENEIHEFVAEAFTNGEFQAILDRIKITPKFSVWDKIVDLVRQFFGMSDTPESISVLQAVMAHKGQLFTGEFMNTTRGAKSVARMNDNYARRVAGNVYDRVMQTARLNRNERRQAFKNLLSNKNRGPLSGMTMEQLRDVFQSSFGGKLAGMGKYMSAFFQRNANNSENMEEPTRISKLWTKARDTNAAQAVELSRIMTDATLYGIHPDKPLRSDENEHLKDDDQRARHADLARRYRALDPSLHTIYNEVRKYYADTIRTETNLQTLNALQAVLEGASTYTEADVERLGLNTVKGLKKEFGDSLSDEERSLITSLSNVTQSNKGPYFPLMRFGKFVVTAERKKESRAFSSDGAARSWGAEQLTKDPTLSVSSPVKNEYGEYVVHVSEKEMRMAESLSEAEEHRKELVAEYGVGNVDREPQLKSQLYKRDGFAQSNAGLRSILSRLEGNPAAQAAIKDFYLRALSDSSFRKREGRRVRRRGIDAESQHRTFANYAKAASYYMSQLRFGGKMAEALKEMDQYSKAVAGGEETSDASAVRLGQVIEEITTRDEITHDPAEVGKKTRFFTEASQFMLLLSPSYWMINLSQPYMVFLPWLTARSSIGDATAALTSAQALVAHPLLQQAGKSLAGLKALWSKEASEEAYSVLDQVKARIDKAGGARAKEFNKMLDVLRQHSIIEMSSTTEMRDIAEGQNLSMGQRVLDASRIMSHLTEVNNRIVTAVAAYDLARNQGKTVQEATEFAMEAVSQTQFNYSTANSPRLFTAHGALGPMGPLVFQFMKYSQHIWALLVSNFHKAVHGGQMERRVAVKTLLGLAATHIAMTGTTGIMLQPAKWAIGLIMMAFGSGGDEPYTLKNAMSGATADRMIRRLTNWIFGNNKVSEMAASGLPRGLGYDLSTRMSPGTLWMMDLNGDTSQSMVGSVVSSVGGPTLSIGMGMYDGLKQMFEGQEWKGLEHFMPKMLKDISQMARFSNEGLTDGAGMEIKGAEDLSPWQLFGKSMGFQPSDVAEAYAGRNAMKDKREYDRKRRSSLLHRMNIADPEERAQIIASEITAFNKTSANVITRSQLLRSMKKFRDREQRSKMYGLDLRDREMGLLEEAEPYMGDDSEDEPDYDYEEAE